MSATKPGGACPACDGAGGRFASDAVDGWAECSTCEGCGVVPLEPADAAPAEKSA